MMNGEKQHVCLDIMWNIKICMTFVKKDFSITSVSSHHEELCFKYFE